ncbi:3316_t:CDS:2, partial [Acaulospora morrowiae]
TFYLQAKFRIYQEIVQTDDWKNAILHRCDSCDIRWQSPKIMSRDNMAKLVVAIQASSSTFAAEIQQNQENRLHSVWNTIIQSYNHEDRKKMRGRSIEFDEFWKFVVDGTTTFSTSGELAREFSGGFNYLKKC